MSQVIFKKGARGAKVIALQQKILALNPLGLPRFGVDGDLGEETLHALSILLNDDTLEDNDVVTDYHLTTIETLLRGERAMLLTPVYVDRRGFASKMERKGKRTRTEYDLVWHQTDCEMGERPARYDGVPVHFVVTSGGQVIQLHDVDERLNAAHHLNGTGISIEVEGHFAGIEGDLSDASYPDYHKDAGRTPQELTPIQIEGAKLCVKLIQEQLAAKKAKLRKQVTHRQGIKGVRRRDPGQGICHKIILVIQAETGIPFDWLYVAGTGEQAPTEWHPESTAKY